MTGVQTCALPISGGISPGQRYFPEGMEAPEWYKPTDRGLEAKIREKLDELKKK